MDTTTTAPKGSGIRRRVSVRTLVAVLVAAASGAYAAVVLAGPSGTNRMAVPFLVVLFAFSEVFVVHFDFRRNSHTFSLVEIPLVLGLLYASPVRIVPAHLLGAGAALYLHRHQRAVKLVFNLASLAVQDCIAIVVISSLSDRSIAARSTWLAVIAGCVIASVVGMELVFGVMRSSGDEPSANERLHSLAFGVIATVVTTSTALAAAVLYEMDPTATVLLVLPVVAIYLAHRSYVVTREQRRKAGVLHESVELLVPARTPRLALEDMLLLVRAAFGVELAALVCRWPDAASITALATLSNEPGRVASLTDGAACADALTDLVDGARSLTFGAPGRGGSWSSAAALTIGDHAVHDGMAVALRADDSTVGHLLVANRLSDVGRFTPDDLRVLETVGRHVVVALADGAPDVAARELRVLEGELRYRARHDGLTGLSNLAGLRDRLAVHLASAVPAGVGVLLVDVLGADDPAAATPEGVTDKVLLVVGQRLRSCAREDDTVARVVGSQFAICARTPRGASDAQVLAERVRGVLANSVNIDGDRVALDASVGMSLSALGSDAEGLLVGAARALDAAGRDGPGGLAIVPL